MARGYVAVRGLTRLTKDLRSVDRGLPKELQKDIRRAVQPTINIAKTLAPFDTGALRGSIRASATQKQVAIRATKKRKGYLYPAIYEYGGRGMREYGPRAYLNPALAATEDRVVRDIANAISHYIERYGL